MLKIDWIKVENLKEGCVTDVRPNIAFSLLSDTAGESLQTAKIRVNDWSMDTTDQINNRYGGILTPFTRYTVRVEVMGVSGERAAAETTFCTGRLDTPWQAKWITDGQYDFPDRQSPVPMVFRRAFTIDKPIRRAWINATALGVYELSINGAKVGQDYFAPGLTSYAHQIQYQTYDALPLLERHNVIMATVAGGWAAGSFNYNRRSKISADRQAFLCELHIECEDGTTTVLCTDESWEVTEESPFRMAEWYDGETCDATVDMARITWKKAGETAPRGNPTILAQYGLPVRVQQVLRPISRTVSPSGEAIYDFGQNFAGVISAHIKGKYDQVVTFRHAEVLVRGELFVQSLRTAKATATYTCIDGEQDYSPKLTYMGFRYVGVRGIGDDDLSLSAFVLHSDMEETGSFSCSNELINRLHENIRWGGKSNFVDIPTDCPQRDEREGWTGDIAVFAQTACFQFDMSRFLDKWLMDVRAEQGRGGGIPMVVPRAGDRWPVMANACWGDSCILVPWAEYLARGDRQLLAKMYPTMRRFLEAAKWWSSFLSLTPTGRHIWRFPFHFGDWCAPQGTARDWIAKGKWVGTAYFANSCDIVANIAELLNKPEDAAYYRSLRAKLIQAYRNAFTDGGGKLKKEFQTGYVLPLAFGMTEGRETISMAENLAKLIRENGNHLGTGFPGTPHLLFALSDNGQTDAAFDLLLQESCPSWLYEVKAGGTTIWERWDALRPDGSVNTGDLTGNKPEEESGGMVSFNHYAGGAVGDWLHRRLVGIEPTSGGYRTFRVAPVPGGGIIFAGASTQTPYGSIASEWHIKNGVFSLSVEVPVSTECELILPDGQRYTVQSGAHNFTCGGTTV